MKKMRKILALLLALCLLTAIPAAVQAQDKPLTLDRVIQVNDTQLVMEFSEPIKVASGEDTEPWVSIRAVLDGSGTPQRADDNTILQWQITLQYVDAKHDRLLGTLAGSALDVKTITDLLNWKGELAFYAERGWTMQLVLEEKTATGEGGNDGMVSSITSADGSKMLTGVKSKGYESARKAIEVNFGYAVDTSKLEPVKVVTAETEKEVFPYQEDWLTVKRAVQVNEKQIVVEFSEPIIVGLTQKKAPWVAVRLVAKGGGGANKTDDGTTILQWGFSLQYLDSKHDRLLLTMSSTAMGIDSISDILNWKGDLIKYSDRNWEVRLVIEELPDDKTNYADCGVCNITTPDGSKMLFPTHLSGYESVQLRLEKDFGYEFDEELAESTQYVAGLSSDAVIMMDGAEYLAVQEEKNDTVETVVRTVEIVQNDPLVIALLIGGGAVVCALAVLITLAVIKKRKAAK